jgi:hypothetical protein
MPVTQTCTITMTPVVGPNGENLVQEDEDCRISINSDPNDPDVLTTATTTVSATSTSDVNNAPTTASVGAEGGGLGAVPVGTSVVAGSSAATTTAASASNTASAAVVVIVSSPKKSTGYGMLTSPIGRRFRKGESNCLRFSSDGVTTSKCCRTRFRPGVSCNSEPVSSICHGINDVKFGRNSKCTGKGAFGSPYWIGSIWRCFRYCPYCRWVGHL